MRTFAAESAANLLGDTWDGQERAIRRMKGEQLVALVEWLDHYDRNYERLSKRLDNPTGFILGKIKKQERPHLSTVRREQLARRIIDGDTPGQRIYDSDGERLAAEWDRFLGRDT